MVNMDNVNEYIALVVKHLLIESVKVPIQALLAGIEDVFPVNDLRCFGPEEMQVGGYDEQAVAVW